MNMQKRHTGIHLPITKEANAAARALPLAACALALILTATTASAQLPAGPPTVTYSDNFSTGSAGQEITALATPTWGELHWDPYGDDGDWVLRQNSDLGEFDGPCQGSNGRWTGEPSFYVRENDSDQPGGGDGQSVVVPAVSMIGHTFPSVLPATDLDNIRIEFDFYGRDDGISRIGAMWHIAAPGFRNAVVTDAYLLYVKDFPDNDDDLSDKASYDLIKRVAGVDTVVATGVIDASSDATWPTRSSVFEDFCYRLRVDYYCGYIRAQIKNFDCESGTCAETNWYTVVEWTDTGTLLPPGMVGMFSGSDTTSEPDNYYDNFELSSWGADCSAGAGCDDWGPWAEAGRENVRFKSLYEGGLIDYSLGFPGSGRKIDVATTAPATTSARNTSTTNYCNGWKLLVDLPAPFNVSDIDKVKKYLQPTSTAVELLNNGSDVFTWQDSFDNLAFLDDPTNDIPNPAFDPIPMVADGATPINNSLLDAYDWYIDKAAPGGAWANDPLAACRKWYVVLITDGVESCASGLPPDGAGYACASGEAASKWKNPAGAVEGLPVFTIGFSEDANQAPPQLTCISDITGGLYIGAKNAQELKDALYDVINFINTEKRTFTAFDVAPPPATDGGPAPVRDYLTVFPLFAPDPKRSVWAGHLFGFRFNKDIFTIPVDSNCDVDRTAVVINDVTGKAWDAAARVTAQVNAHTEANPKRFVFMGSNAGGPWARHNLSTIPTNTTLRDEFKLLLEEPAISNLKTQEVVNFVRDFWMDDDATASPDPRDADPSTPANDARPALYASLGDIFHSQPVIVNPPNSSMYVFDYGFGDPTEAGAHDYHDFIEEQAKRRRAVLVGANDGLLHAFDGGVWDRDRAVGSTETYDGQHDLGDGTELFAYLPQSVMDKLYFMTYGQVQQYFVDGLIATGDVFINYDGDSDREWRTIAIATMRRGGRGMVALDITQPDPVDPSTFDPVVSTFPGCMDGTTPNCDGEYPKILWEFEDKSDANANCPGGLVGDQCAPYWDLGWTWSKPAIARIAVYNATTPSQPDDVFVAFFGGGWDKLEADKTGNFFYGVDIETGAVLLKQNMFVAMPGSPTALDADIDGFHERIYFADSDGGIWRLQFPAPDDVASTGADAGTFTRIFDFRGDFPDRQRFFTRPVTVPALFDGGAYTWALALGTGDRANLKTTDGAVDHFFFVLDVADATTRGAADLRAVNYTDLNGSFDCTSSALDPAGGTYGWYLNLRPNEKVMYDATVVAGYVLFPTFDPTPDVTPSHNVPDECVPGGAGGGGGGGGGGGAIIACTASGNGRSYKLWFECGLGDYNENTEIYTASKTFTTEGTTHVTMIDDDGGDEEEFPNVMGHVVTNWRQD